MRAGAARRRGGRGALGRRRTSAGRRLPRPLVHLEQRFSLKGRYPEHGPPVNQDKDPKSVTSSKREVPDAAGGRRPALPGPPSKEPAPPMNAPAPSESVAPEVEEVSGALLIDDSWPDVAPAPPPRQISKPPPPPLSRMTAGGTLRPAPGMSVAQVAPPPPSRPALHVPSLPPPPAPKQPRSPAPAAGTSPPSPAVPPDVLLADVAALTSEDAAAIVPLEAPTEPSLPIERESALRLPRAWGGVAASVVRDVVHK